MTQLERAQMVRAQLLAMLPDLDRLSRSLSVVLDEAQNAPPDGASDGSIGETQYSQLRKINESVGKLTLALMFDARAT